MTALCIDESVLIYDDVVRKVWTEKWSKPGIVATG